ncbi:hypothetical protein RF11_13732 [Thelohanellus kitauei]|uniref:Uncharacterized protein n=1 Tax=Thelohanellus kitauei TaxID=669202 RepID=A0A0C2MHT2_THEKT|nr:hypothetical protein RF11_13732 [Thelohanellus kitauei]
MNYDKGRSEHRLRDCSEFKMYIPLDDYSDYYNSRVALNNTVFLGSIIVVLLIMYFRHLYLSFRGGNSSETFQVSREVTGVYGTIPLINTEEPPKYCEIHDCPSLSVVPTGIQVAGIKNVECPPYVPQTVVEVR